MNLMELKKSMSNNQLLPLYIFTGDEVAVLNIYVNKLSKMFNGDTICADTLESIVPRIKSNSLIFSSKCMYIIRNDKTVMSADKIWNSLKKGTFQKDNVIVLIFDSIDKRGKFYKEFSDYIVTFDPLSTDMLVKYINKDLKLSTDRSKYLVSICKNNYNQILLEVDKIRCLAKHCNISDDEAFDECVNNGAFYIPPDGEIFDLLNAIMSRDIDKTYNQFQMFIQRGDSPMAILSLLHSNLKAVLQIQCADGLSNLGQVTGLNGFQIKNAQKFSNLYSEEEIIRIIKINRFCEKCIKQTGLIDTDMILDFLFVKIF